MYSGITTGRVLNGELLYTKILEVNLFAFAQHIANANANKLTSRIFVYVIYIYIYIYIYIFIYIYIQRITMCPHGYHHSGSMATPALGTRDVRFYIYIDQV